MMFKHGYARSTDPLKQSTYKAWQAMIQRCLNTKNKWFKHYGGRGIKVYGEWVGGTFDKTTGFVAFLKHVGKKPRANLSLDRIDNDGDYEPGNVRWATYKQQANNKQRSRKRKKLPYKYFWDDGTHPIIQRYSSDHLIVIRRWGWNRPKKAI